MKYKNFDIELGSIFSGLEVHFASSWLQVEISDQCFSETETASSKGSNHLGTSDSRTEVVSRTHGESLPHPLLFYSSAVFLESLNLAPPSNKHTVFDFLDQGPEQTKEIAWLQDAQTKTVPQQPSSPVPTYCIAIHTLLHELFLNLNFQDLGYFIFLCMRRAMRVNSWRAKGMIVLPIDVCVNYMENVSVVDTCEAWYQHIDLCSC